MIPVFATRVLQVEPPLVDLSTLYPVIAEPPLSAGADQVRLICEEDSVVAVSPVGEDEATAGLVAEAVVEAELVPTEVIDETL